MERPDVGGAVAEERDRDAWLRAELERERGAYDARQAAADDGIRAHVPALDVVEMHRAAIAVGTALELAVELRHHLVRRRSLGQRVTVRAMRRRDDVPLLERAADAHRHCLLPDRDVEEARELTGPETLLDLLLEAPDQEHLAEEIS